MATRLPRNFAVDRVNGAYGDEEDRLAQAIGDAVNGPGGPSSGTSSATIASGVDQSGNVTAIRTNSDNSSTAIANIDQNIEDIEDAIGTQSDATTVNTVIGLLKATRNSLASLVTNIGTTIGVDLSSLLTSAETTEDFAEQIQDGIGNSLDLPANNPVESRGLNTTVKGLWRDMLLKFDELIANSNSQVLITPISHDINVTPGTPVTLLASGGELRNIMRVEIALDTPAVVEILIGSTSVAKFFNAELVTLPFEEFGFLSNNSTNDLTVNITETVGTVRLTGTTWYEATGNFI